MSASSAPRGPTLGHLTRRFAGALWPAGPPAADEEWVAATLSPSQLALWRRMRGPDRRHAVAVAHRVVAALGPAASTPAVRSAALLHDVGKLESGLGTLARLPATVLGMARGHDRARQWSGRDGFFRRVGLYLDHPRLGAALLEEAGSDPLTVTWAAEHHLPPGRWHVPANLGEALKAADDD